MSRCCPSNQSDKSEQSSCCGGAKGRTVLLYACSGGANVGEVSDKAARELMFAGCGTMFCLAGLGGDIDGMVQTARDADVNVVIDGCPMDCAKKTFDRHGIRDYRQIKVTDLGIEKVKGVRCTDEQVARTVARCREVIAGKGGGTREAGVDPSRALYQLRPLPGG
ncbi:MAG: hypothetical protein BIFFINMI_02709 [Phycisphaerae bacterium]|nr:hypothetical protein [Phycisphaerae bacterium]